MTGNVSADLDRSGRSARWPAACTEPDDGAVLWGLLLVVWLATLPLASVRTWTVALLVASVWVLGLLTAWRWRHRPRLAWQRLSTVRWPVLLLLALATWMALQATPLPEPLVRTLSPQAWAVQQGVTGHFMLSLDPLPTRTQASLTLALALAFVLVVLVARDRARLDRLAFGLVLIGVFQAVLALFLWSIQARYTVLFYELQHDVAKGTFGNRNHLAGFLMLVLSVGVGLMVARLGSEREHRSRHWRGQLAGVLAFVLSAKMRLRLMLVVLVMALVLTRSRMGNTAFFAALLVTGLLTLLLSRHRRDPALAWLVASLVVIDVLVVGTWVGLEQVVTRLQGTEWLIEHGGSQESVEQRQMAARYALELVRDFPLTGTGAGSFYGAFIPYQPPGDAFFDHAHNDYVEMAANLGLVGFGLTASLVLLSAYQSLRVLWTRRSSMARGLSFGALMAMVGMAIHASVDFNLHIPANALLMVVVLALGWAAAALPERRLAGTATERLGIVHGIR